MKQDIIYGFAIVGVCVVAIIIAMILSFVKEEFQEWRRKGCKIKCLCKHKYKYDWTYGINYSQHCELGLKCEKCGKIKQLWVDYDSFKDM